MVLQDYSFLSSKVSQKVLKKLNKKIKRKKPSSIIDLVKIIQNYWKEVEKNPEMVSFEEKTQLLHSSLPKPQC